MGMGKIKLISFCVLITVFAYVGAESDESQQQSKSDSQSMENVGAEKDSFWTKIDLDDGQKSEPAISGKSRFFYIPLPNIPLPSPATVPTTTVPPIATLIGTAKCNFQTVCSINGLITAGHLCPQICRDCDFRCRVEPFGAACPVIGPFDCATPPNDRCCGP